MKPISDERRAELRDKFQSWPGEMALISTDISDLLVLLNTKSGADMSELTPELIQDLRDTISNHLIEPNENWLEVISDVQWRFLLSLLDAPPAPTIYQLRPEVKAFAALMEGELRKHGHRLGWKECDPEWLMVRLKEEAAELAQAILTHEESIPAEAADVANFAMMIADVEGGLGPPTPPAPTPKRPITDCDEAELLTDLWGKEDIHEGFEILEAWLRGFGIVVEPEEGK